jgi:DnaJ-class molecular chaperone
MVCDVCNGKGYIRIKDEELPCYECFGRGEYLLSDGDKLRTREAEEYSEAYRAGAVSG